MKWNTTMEPEREKESNLPILEVRFLRLRYTWLELKLLVSSTRSTWVWGAPSYLEKYLQVNAPHFWNKQVICKIMKSVRYGNPRDCFCQIFLHVTSCVNGTDTSFRNPREKIWAFNCLFFFHWPWKANIKRKLVGEVKLSSEATTSLRA